MSLNLNHLPNTPGVYLFRDKEKKIIYVGKAANLKKRVSSYFGGRFADPKTKKLVSKTEKIDFVNAHSEIEALILESEFIKRYKPHYNIVGRDDKSYLYLAITKEEFPVPVFARFPKENKGEFQYFGPFTDSRALKKTLKFLRKIFPYRSGSCINAKKPCLYYQLGQCPGVCVGQVTGREYRKNIRGIVNFFSGKKDKINKDLSREMAKEAKARHFEKAAQLRDKIINLEKLKSISIFNDPVKDNALLELKTYFKLKSLPERVETFDISNIAGKFACGSMAVYERGMPNVSEYRKFKIKTVKGINDYKMMGEVLHRRFKNVGGETPNISELPDVVIIDGGKGHLTTAYKILKNLGLEIPVFSIAKRNEEVFGIFKDASLKTSKISKIEMPTHSEALYLLRRMRDEAHRFAIAYFHSLKEKDN